MATRNIYVVKNLSRLKPFLGTIGDRATAKSHPCIYIIHIVWRNTTGPNPIFIQICLKFTEKLLHRFLVNASGFCLM